MIAQALVDLASSDGPTHALGVAERWQAALESIVECGSPVERASAWALLEQVSQALTVLIGRAAPVAGDALYAWASCGECG